MDDVELQQRLTRLAERTAPPPRASLAGAVVARHRARRRQVAATAGLVAAVAALVVVTSTVLDGRSAEPVSATAVATDRAEPAVDVLAGPTRGSLADDEVFVEAVRRLPWTASWFAGPAVPDAPVDTRRVVFAGDVGGARLVLVAGANTVEPVVDDPELQTDLGALSDVATAWFLGPAGAAPEQLVLQSVPRGTRPDQPVAAFDAATGALVVVAAPGAEVSVSLRPEIAADGQAVRSYQAADTRDGVAAVALPVGSTSSQALRYLVGPSAAAVPRGPDGLSGAESRAEVPVSWLRPAPAPSAADALTGHDAGHVLDELGLPAADVRFSVLWAGDVPSPAPAGTSQVRLLAAELPSGAVFLQASLTVVQGTSSSSTWCGRGIQPAGLPLAERTVALRCDATDMTGRSDVVSSLVVVGPPTAVSARALDPAGEVLAELPLTDGVAVAPFPEGAATVETLAADGTVLATTAPLTTADLGD